MLCPYCHQIAPSSGNYCPHCGKSLSRAASVLREVGSMSPQKKKRYWILGAALALFILVTTMIGGILFFVFYQIKNSEANKLAIEVLKNNPAASQALGKIEDIGWPLGSISVQGGGTGKASFSMSVTGSKSKGKYYAELRRIHGEWNFISGKLKLKNGAEVSLSPSPQ